MLVAYNQSMRRYLQFRLRTLFVLTALAAVTFAVGTPFGRCYQAFREQLETERRAQVYTTGWDVPYESDVGDGTMESNSLLTN